MGGFDRERALANEEAKKRKKDALERRKRTALRILEAGGTVQEAASEARASAATVKRWRAECQAAVDTGPRRSE